MDDVVEKFPNLMTAQVGSTSIPTADAIHAAKKKREQMRKGIVVHEEEDFVALDDVSERYISCPRKKTYILQYRALNRNVLSVKKMRLEMMEKQVSWIIQLSI